MIFGKAIEESTNEYVFRISTDIEEVIKTVKIVITLSDYPIVASYDSEIKLIKYQDYTNYKPLLCYSKSLKYSVDKELPKSLIYDEKSGRFSGIILSDIKEPIVYKFSCSNNNGISETRDISLSVIEVDYPILISKNDTVNFTIGEDLNNEMYFKVIGNSLIHSISPELPDGIKMNKSTGLFSGYAKYALDSRNYTITVTNSKLSISFKIEIRVIKNTIPMIPDSSIQRNTSIGTGTVVSIRLFESFGEDLNIKIIPYLPDGFILSANGYLQGISMVTVPIQNYTIRITDENDNYKEISLLIEFEVLKCEGDDEFPSNEIGTTSFKKCGKGKRGFISRKCIFVDGKARWEKSIDECSSNNVLLLIVIVVLSVIVGGILFLSTYCIFVRYRCGTKRVRKNAIKFVDSSKNVEMIV